MRRDVRYREGEVAWVDLTTSDLERSGAFYSSLFGWDIEELDDETGGYQLATVAGQPVAGLLPADADQPIEAWTVYLAVDDIDEAYALADDSGAHPLVPPFVLGEHGRFALVADPGGAVVGLWQGDSHGGTQIHSFAGSPGWFEIHTKGFEAACTFYRETFGLELTTLADEPGFRYSTARLESTDSPAFGVFDVAGGRPAQVPSAWSVYFLTADADRDAERAVELGAQLTFGPEDSIYGRMATFIDPLGAAFNLIEPPLPEPDLEAAAPAAVEVDGSEAGEAGASGEAGAADDAGAAQADIGDEIGVDEAGAAGSATSETGTATGTEARETAAGASGEAVHPEPEETTGAPAEAATTDDGTDRTASAPAVDDGPGLMGRSGD